MSSMNLWFCILIFYIFLSQNSIYDLIFVIFLCFGDKSKNNCNAYMAHLNYKRNLDFTFSFIKIHSIERHNENENTKIDWERRSDTSQNNNRDTKLVQRMKTSATLSLEELETYTLQKKGLF